MFNTSFEPIPPVFEIGKDMFWGWFWYIQDRASKKSGPMPGHSERMLHTMLHIQPYCMLYPVDLSRWALHHYRAPPTTDACACASALTYCGRLDLRLELPGDADESVGASVREKRLVRRLVRSDRVINQG